MKKIRKISCFIFTVLIIFMFAIQIGAVEARVMPLQGTSYSVDYIIQPYGTLQVRFYVTYTYDAQNGALISVDDAGVSEILSNVGVDDYTIEAISSSVDTSTRTISVDFYTLLEGTYYGETVAWAQYPVVYFEY